MFFQLVDVLWLCPRISNTHKVLPDLNETARQSLISHHVSVVTLLKCVSVRLSIIK